MTRSAPAWPDVKARETVNTMLGIGVPYDQVLKLTKDPTTGKAITDERFRAVFAEEIETAEIMANAKVLANLYKHATGGGKEAVKAALHWVSTHKTVTEQKDLETRIKEALQLSERLMTREYE